MAVSWAKLLAGFGLAIALWEATPALADPPSQASFDCAHASGPIEGAICANPDLAQRDATMAQLFARVRTGALGAGPSGELAAQRQWLAQRDKDCGAAADVAKCLRTDYDQRLQALAVAALIRAPEPAFAELKRQNLANAPLYEAIYVVATQPASDARTKTVAALIGPAFAKVADAQGEMLGEVKTAHDAAASVPSFDTFIDLAGVVDDLQVTMPCEAIVKQPGLIHALDSQFGSSMDNQLGGADCDAMLPPPPKFAALASAGSEASTSDPDCTGTIRYAGLRDYSRLLIQAQLDRIEAPVKVDMSVARTAAAWRRRRAAQVEAAEADLAAYYATSLHMPRSKATADARRAVLNVVDAAFGVCQ